ncbi:hypothetical protein ACFY7C_00625 [Streptomyces sp. NPDC012769]|uniref:hypothetical protein n=1 Tax=Streptomyces sp. NPDC012769 TaxID=3364848 RepID=UPI0036B40C7E
MPSISCRLVQVGGRPGFLSFGSSRSSRNHRVSVVIIDRDLLLVTVSINENPRS